MQAVKQYLADNFERFFVLVILAAVATITYFIPQKIAFLNFFYIPVLLAAYYLGVRTAMLGAVLTVILVVIYAYIYPPLFLTVASLQDLVVTISVWGGFLILSAVFVGKLMNKLQEKIAQAEAIQKELTDKEAMLEKINKELFEHSTQLEQKVAERTEDIEKSKQIIDEHKRKVEEALYSTMDPEVVKLIINKRLRTEKRDISVLFSDLKGFTRYSEENRAEVVVSNLNKYLSEMEAVLLKYNAHIDKYMGDGIMAEFGAPIDYECYALQSVLCGLEMQDTIEQSGYPWEMRIGIATGESIIGLTGHKRQAYTTLGDTVNLASRIEGLSNPGRVTVDEATYKATSRFVDFKLKSLNEEEGADNHSQSASIANKIAQLDHEPENFSLIKEIGFLLLETGEIDQANSYFKKALRLNSDDNDVKIAYADTSIKAHDREGTAIRGKKKRIRLYEAVGIKDPLLDRRKIPQALYDKYFLEVNSCEPYPGDILLPVECIDGSVRYSRVVGFLSYAIADKLGLPHQTKLDVLKAGYFADFGKSIVSHHILNRRGPLNSEELKNIKLHPQESVRKMQVIGYGENTVCSMVETHHENFNGSGYPHGLSGDGIPIGGRIVSLADSYNSMTSWRPYRERWECSAALSELEKDTERGKFDPKILDVLIGLIT